jgi:transposase
VGLGDRRYRDLLRLLSDTTERPTILGPKERQEILERLRRLEQVEEELRHSEAETRRLAREKAELEERFARYRQRHPETVGLKLGRPYFLRRTPVEPPPVLEHGHPGAKVGHPPHLRPPPSRVDRRIRIPLRACPRCGGHRLSRVQELRHRFIEEIPPPATVVTDYRIERRYCRDCARLVESPVPDALPRARFGLRLMHLVAQLKILHRLPTEQIPPLLQSVYGVHLSEGEVLAILTRLAKVYRPTFERFRDAMRDAPAKYLDETAHSVNGDGAYLWVAATPSEAIYRVAPTRGHQTILDLLGPTPTGTVVHDRFVAYQQAARKTGLPQQVCWFHLIGDAKELAELYGTEGAEIRDALQSAYRKAVRWRGQGTEDRVRELERELETSLARRSRTSVRCERFVRNLARSRPWWFPFVRDARIDGTNNRAERALRPSVVARKISGGSRSWQGARTFATLTSIVQTLRLRGQTLVRDGPNYLAAS